jgi:type II secretory pathway component PulK
MTDEDRKLSLNAAPPEMMARLFQRAGLTPEEAVALAAAVVDWRDEDNKEERRGAEGIYYRSLSGGYECKNGPFEYPEELLLVRGMTPALYRALEPHVTVYGSGKLNLNTATIPALESLGLTRTGVAGLLAFRAGEDGQQGTADDRRLVSVAGLEQQLADFVPVEDLAALMTLANDEVLGVKSEAFRMRIEARSATGVGRLSADCVIDRKGVVKLWMER